MLDKEFEDIAQLEQAAGHTVVTATYTIKPGRIVQVRGTSGSGKSTLVRNILHQTGYPTPNCHHVEGRKQPLFYTSDRQPRPLAILGHYESACGGVDTISKYLGKGEGNSYDTTFGLIRTLAKAGHNVLFEGLLVSGDQARTLALHKEGYDIQVVAFDLPVEFCIEAINQRRQTKGNLEPVDEENTRAKHRLLEKCCLKLTAAGVPVHRANTRHEANLLVHDLLEIPRP